MKEPNVLEASDLCMNGNPVTHEPLTFQQSFFRTIHMFDAIPPPHKSFNCLSGNYEGCLQLRVKKEFSKFCKWLKYWFTPLGKEIDLYEKNQEDYVKLKLKTIRDNEIKQAQKLSYVLAKATKETERLAKALNRMHRRKKRYSISTPIVRK